MGASGSIDYSVVSGNYYAYTTGQTGSTDSITKGTNPRRRQTVGYLTGSTDTIIGSLTVKYFQRVYASDLAAWCYYTKTSIDPTPLSSETTPEWSGVISNHSVIKILEIY